jgi:hypothetical protein
VTDSNNDEILTDDLLYIASSMENLEKSSAYSTRLLNFGIVELCQRIILGDFYLANSGKGIIPSENDRMLVVIIVLNLTSMSTEACQRVLEIEFYKDLFHLLRPESIDSAVVKYRQNSLADAVMKVLYNVIQVITQS